MFVAGPVLVLLKVVFTVILPLADRAVSPAEVAEVYGLSALVCRFVALNDFLAIPTRRRLHAVAAIKRIREVWFGLSRLGGRSVQPRISVRRYTLGHAPV